MFSQRLSSRLVEFLINAIDDHYESSRGFDRFRSRLNTLYPAYELVKSRGIFNAITEFDPAGSGEEAGQFSVCLSLCPRQQYWDYPKFVRMLSDPAVNCNPHFFVLPRSQTG